MPDLFTTSTNTTTITECSYPEPKVVRTWRDISGLQRRVYVESLQADLRGKTTWILIPLVLSLATLAT